LAADPWIELIGAPGSGKSTWLNEHKTPGDTPNSPPRTPTILLPFRRIRLNAGFFRALLLCRRHRVLQLQYYIRTLVKLEERSNRVQWRGSSLTAIDEGPYHKFLSLYSYQDRPVPWRRLIAGALRNWRPRVLLAFTAPEEELVRRLDERGYPARMRNLSPQERSVVLKRYEKNLSELVTALPAHSSELIILRANPGEDGAHIWREVKS